jgi:hypothetical protein
MDGGSLGVGQLAIAEGSQLFGARMVGRSKGHEKVSAAAWPRLKFGGEGSLLSSD